MSESRPRFLILVFIALSQFSSALMHSITGVTLPAMSREFGASGVELGLTESIFLGTTAALLLPFGRFADATDKNTLFKVGLLVLSIATFAIGMQPTIETVIVTRFCQGIGAALLTAIGMAIVADIAPPKQLGRMLGLAIAATYIGLASGPFFSGLITTHLGWRWVYFLGALPPLVAFLLARNRLPGRWRRPVTRVNLLNSSLLAAGIGSIIAGAVMFKVAGIGITLAVLGVFVLFLFVFVERRSKNPLLKIDEVWQNRALSRALITQFLIYCGTIGTTFLLSLYLQLIRGNTPEVAGHILVIGPVVMAIFAPLAGRLADRISPRHISAFGGVLVVVSVSLPALIDDKSGIELVIGAMVMQGLGFALFSAPNIALIMNSVEAADRGQASALSGLSRSMGMVVSMFIVTAFISISLGDTAIDHNPRDFLHALSWSFTLFVGLAILGVIQAIRPQRRANITNQ